MKNLKKVLATLCSATLIVSSSVTAFASSGVTPEAGSTAGDGNIVAFSVETVTVPTAIKVSFNPQEWDVTIRGTQTVDDQIVSLNYGIASDATLDKKIKVSFTAAGTTGTGTKDIVFVDSIEEAQEKSDTNTKGAAPGEYKMYLAVAPSTDAVAGGYATGATSATPFAITTGASNVTADLLADADMTASEVGVQVFKDNKAEISYKLDAMEYALKSGSTIGFDTAQSAMANMFEKKTLGSIVGFTFVGAMNPNVDWTKVKFSALKITPTYEVQEVDGTETVLSGDGAPYNVIGEASAAAATETTATFDSTMNPKTYKISLPTAASDPSDITNLKVNGVAVTEFDLNSAKDILRVTKPTVRDTLAGDFSTTEELTFTFTYNETNYVAIVANDK